MPDTELSTEAMETKDPGALVKKMLYTNVLSSLTAVAWDAPETYRIVIYFRLKEQGAFESFLEEVQSELSSEERKGASKNSVETGEEREIFCAGETMEGRHREGHSSRPANRST